MTSSPAVQHHGRLSCSPASSGAFEVTSSQQCRSGRCRKDKKGKTTIAWFSALSFSRSSSDPNQERQKEWNEHIGMGKRGAPNRRQCNGKRSWHSTIFQIGENNFEFKGKIVRNVRQHFMVLGNVQYDFSVNEATLGNICMWAAVRLHQHQDRTQRDLRNKKCSANPSDIHHRGKATLPTCSAKIFRYVLCCTKIRRNILRRWCMFSRIPCCVLVESVYNILIQQESGTKTDPAISSQLQNTENWTTSMENRLCSSGRFFPGRTTAQLL